VDVGRGRGHGWGPPVVLGLGKVYMTFVIILHGLSSLPSQEPGFCILAPTRVCSGVSWQWGVHSKELVSPALPPGRLCPVHGHFLLGLLARSPHLPRTMAAQPGIPGSGLLPCPLGNVPLAYLLSNNPMGSGTLLLSLHPPSSLLLRLPATAQPFWTQTPVPE